MSQMSVRLSVKRVNCDKTKQTYAHILNFLYHNKDRCILFCDTEKCWWDAPSAQHFGPK